MHLLHVVNFLGVPGDDCVDVDEDRRDRRERVMQLPGQSSTSSVKGGPLRNKFFLKILLPFKNKNNFTLDNSKYGHIT